MKTVWVVVMAAGLVAVPALAQEAAGGAEVSFHFERPGLPVPRYTLTVRDDGKAVYEGEEILSSGSVRPASTAAAPPPPGTPFRSAITISPATTKKIFGAAKVLKNFNVTCASKAKNVADTGKKTLAYKGPGGEGSCEYNFSENKNVVQLTDTFLAISETMDEGRQLDHLHRYDRLGLDAALGILAQEVTDGRAMELGTISGTLRSIAADADVMQRVRVRASQLLSLLPPESQTKMP